MSVLTKSGISINSQRGRGITRTHIATCLSLCPCSAHTTDQSTASRHRILLKVLAALGPRDNTDAPPWITLPACVLVHLDSSLGSSKQCGWQTEISSRFFIDIDVHRWTCRRTYCHDLAPSSYLAGPKPEVSAMDVDTLEACIYLAI